MTVSPANWSLRLALLLVSLLLPLGARASLVRSFDLAGLVTEAHEIVRGRVVSQESHWNAERTRIYRTSVVEVSESLSGTAGEAPSGRTIRVKQLGGAVGETSMLVPGTATLRVGEEVVLFLRTDGVWHYLVGMGQGKYTVTRRNGEALVSRAPLREARAEGARASGPAPEPRSLRRLREDVHRLGRRLAPPSAR